MENRILMIVNEFPPTGESGVQRPLKFVKYLSQLNWQTILITPAKPPKNVIDYSLVEEIPKDVKFYYTRSLGFKGKSLDNIEVIRFNLVKKTNSLKPIIWSLIKVVNDFLFPLDKQIGWVPFALVKAIMLIKKHKIRNVYITAYPYSALLIGVLLKRIFGQRIFWIADYRDAWQFDPMLQYNVHKFRMNTIVKTDELVLRTCDRAVFTTDFVKDRYVSKYPYLQGKVITITNGYDEDDFKAIKPIEFAKFTYLYMGKIYSFKANPIPILSAIEKSGIKDCQYIHIGTISNEVKYEIERLNYNWFSFAGYKSHHEALSYATGANVNLIIQNDDEESQGVFLAKIFELLRVGKPILYVGPRKSIIKDLIIKTNAGLTAYIGDEQDILEKIMQISSNHSIPVVSIDDIEQFSRITLTKKLISLYQD